MKWTPDKVKELKKLFDKGLTRPAMAEKMGLTFGQVRNQIERHGWKRKAPKFRHKGPQAMEQSEKLKGMTYERNFYKNKVAKLEEKKWKEKEFLEELKTVLAVQRPLKPFRIPKLECGHKAQEAVLLFSDCQIGEKIQKKETGFIEYNIKIFEQRLKKLYVSLVNIVERHRKDHPVDCLNVFMLGDIVEGTGNIFRGQGSRIVTDVVEQSEEGVKMISNFIRSLARHFKEIKIVAIPGNHGRVRKKGEDLTYVNWDYMIYFILKHILSLHENIDFELIKQWWKIAEVLGWKFYLEHGEYIYKYWGISWYGIERRDNRLLQMMRALKKEYDYYCIGHLHEAFEWDKARGERIANGSFCSGNPYAMRELALSTRPTQKLFGVHPQVGITWRYNIRLDVEKSYIK